MNEQSVMKFSSLFLIAMLMTGCINRPQEKSPQTPLAAAPATPPPIKAKVPTPSSISEITLERKPGMTRKPEPWYTLTLRSDGTATKINLTMDEPRGTFHAAIPQSEFDHLAQLVETSKFSNYEPFYGAAAFDIPVITVSVVKNGKRKEVEDCGKPFQPEYEKEAPKSLKQIEEQIDLTVAKANWQKVSDSTRLPK